MLAGSPLPSRECQRARGGCAADGPTAGVVEPGGVAGRRGRAQGLAPGVVVPDAAVAVRRGRADAPALRVIEPSLRLGACLITREDDDDRDQNSKQRYIGTPSSVILDCLIALSFDLVTEVRRRRPERDHLALLLVVRSLGIGRALQSAMVATEAANLSIIWADDRTAL